MLAETKPASEVSPHDLSGDDLNEDVEEEDHDEYYDEKALVFCNMVIRASLIE